MTIEDRVRAILEPLGISEDRILAILAVIVNQDANSPPAPAAPTITSAPAAAQVVDDIVTADAAHKLDEAFAYTLQTATGNDTIKNFDNLSGDGSSSDRLDLSAVFNALGGKYTDGVNDFADRKAALHLSVGDFDGDGAKDDAKLSIDGLKDFSVAFLNPTGGGVGSFHIASEAGGQYADIVIGDGTTSAPEPSTQPLGQPSTQPISISPSNPAPQPTASPPAPSAPAPAPSPSTPDSTNMLYQGKFPPHYMRLENGVNIERTNIFHISDQELKLMKQMGVEHIRVFLTPGEYVGLNSPIDPATNAGFQSTVKFMDRAIDAGLAVVISPLGGNYYNTTNPMNESWLRSISSYIQQRFDPQDVFIEIFNEPFMQGGQNQQAQWWSIASKLATAVRESAPDFTIIVPPNGYNNGDWKYMNSLINSAPLPIDNVVYQVHYYEPLYFTHQGATWNSQFTNIVGRHYPGEGGYNAQKIDQEMASLKAWADKYDVFVAVNEFGVLKTHAVESERAQYINDVRTAVEKYGFGWSVWDFDKGFSISQEINGVQQIKPIFQEALGLGQWYDGDPRWEDYVQGDTLPVPPVTPDGDSESTPASQVENSPPPSSPVAPPPSGNPSVILADSAYAKEEKFVFTAADLNKTFTIHKFDNLTQQGNLNDHLDLTAIFSVLGGNYVDGVNDFADRQSALALVRLDLDNDGWTDDVQIKIQGLSGFTLNMIDPASPSPGAFHVSASGNGTYDDILIA